MCCFSVRFTFGYLTFLLVCIIFNKQCLVYTYPSDGTFIKFKKKREKKKGKINAHYMISNE